MHEKENGAPPLVVAVVLNWNGGEMNLRCLEHLFAAGWPSLRVVFVDNGSTDGSGEAVRARWPGVEYLGLDRNHGFTGGNNRGIHRALEMGAEMVLLLNNDVQVDPGFLPPLVEALREEGPGIAGPKMLEPSGKLWSAGGRLAFHQNLTRLRGFGRADNGRYDRRERVDYIPACCLLVSREVFERVGLLDEDYFCYVEDVEFCMRARRAAFPVIYCPRSRVVHHFSHSTGGGYTPARKYMNALNSVRFLRTHGSLKSWIAFWIFDVAAWPLLLVLRLLQGRARGALAKGRGIVDGLAGRRVDPERVARYRGLEECRR